MTIFWRVVRHPIRFQEALKHLEQQGRIDTIGQPNKLSVIFGRRITERYKGKLQTVIEDINLPNPVMRSHYKNGFIKQYVRDNRLLRTEAATNNVNDYGVAKAMENLQYTLASLRYDLSKLRAKRLVEKLPKSRRYRFTAEGYRICVVYLKFFEKIYAPLTSAILARFKDDKRLPETRTTQLDKFYRAVLLAQLPQFEGVNSGRSST